MIKATYLNISLSTTAAVGTAGGAIYYSKKTNINNQPVTYMAGVGNEYQSSADSNMVNDLTRLLSIDLSSVADLTKSLGKLGGLKDFGSLTSNLNTLSNEDVNVGEDDEETDVEDLSDDDEDEQEEVGGGEDEDKDGTNKDVNEEEKGGVGIEDTAKKGEEETKTKIPTQEGGGSCYWGETRSKFKWRGKRWDQRRRWGNKGWGNWCLRAG